MTRAAQRWTLAAWCAAAAALACYGACRVRFVGGCDSSSYLLESMRLRGVASGLKLDPGVPVAGPLAPLCMIESGGVVTSVFPPGFPLLVAIAGLFGLQFFVTPLLAAASGLALFYALRSRVSPAIALGTAIAWLSSPMVVWGGTQLMSDLPAAAFAVFAVLAVQSKRPAWAGALFGFSIAVRPTQALLAPALLLLDPHARRQLRLALAAAAVIVGALLLLRLSRGGVARAYGVNLRWLDGSAWRRQLMFLLRHTLALQPPVAILAVVGLGARPRATFSLLVWYASFLALYSCWRWPYDAWWWMRYMLPALPAVFMTAAQGADALAGLVTRRLPGLSTRWRTTSLPILGAVVVLGYGGWTFAVSPAKGSLTTSFDRRYPDEVAAVSRIVPAGSLVGAVNLSGPLRLYAGYQSFFWCHADTVALLRWAVAAGRPVYTTLDPGERDCNPAAATLAGEIGYDLNLVGTLPSGRIVRRLGPP